MPIHHGKPRPGERLEDRMREKGLRLTGQRMLLARLLEQATEHLDAESVFRRARSIDPSISRFFMPRIEPFM